MKTNSKTARWSLQMCAVAALLAGCAEPTAQNPLPDGNQLIRANAAGAGVERSWMAPEAQHEDLVYVSNVQTNSVTVYSFYRQKLVGRLMGVNGPYGLCSDPNGDVWVVGWGNNKLVEYAHGSTKPVKELKVNSWDADLYACAVDPVTGDLAVTNWGPENWYQGNVLVYPHASGTPRAYAPFGVWFFYGCTYDNAGNLYVNGWDAYRNAFISIGELPKGEHRMKVYTLNPNLQPPLIGSIQWDGRHIAMADLGWLYLYDIRHDQAVLTGNTPLTYHFPLGMFWIGTIGGKQQILAPDSAGKPYAVQYWGYPSGGKPSATITDGLDGSYGVTVSPAKGS